jgi:hypothetical protein
MWNLSFAFFRASENWAVSVIFGAKDVVELDQDTRDIGIGLTKRRVVAWLGELHGTNILTGH